MHKCYYRDRLEVVDGRLCRIVTAMYDDRKYSCHYELDVYREYEDGEACCRNVYCSMYGYYVSFPGEVTSVYRNGCNSFVQELQDWGEVDKIKCFPSVPLSAEEESLIVEKYPAFKYVLAKWRGTIGYVLRALAIWKQHKEIEMVLAAGYENVAFNRSLYRLSEPKKREVVRFMREHGEDSCKSLTLSDIQQYMKLNLPIDDFIAYKRFCWNVNRSGIELWRYLKRQGRCDRAGLLFYNDYANMLRNSGHDTESGYWKYPKDLSEAHDKLVSEINKKKLLEQKSKYEQYYKVVRKFVRLNADIDGFSVFVPQSIDDIKFQADTLNQCLITADYVLQVINRQCVLVFIRHCGKPVATAQIDKRKNVVQFYADEHDWKNCLPSDEVKSVLDKWLACSKLKIA